MGNRVKTWQNFSSKSNYKTGRVCQKQLFQGCISTKDNTPRSICSEALCWDHTAGGLGLPGCPSLTSALPCHRPTRTGRTLETAACSQRGGFTWSRVHAQGHCHKQQWSWKTVEGQHLSQREAAIPVWQDQHTSQKRKPQSFCGQGEHPPDPGERRATCAQESLERTLGICSSLLQQELKYMHRRNRGRPGKGQG